MLNDTTSWYASWFDTPYYHILYKDRDYLEGEQFMRNLTQHFALKPNDRILDLACGKGRHSRFLSTLGFDVTGVDLSKNSIAHAKQFEKGNLHFEVHDMCKPMGSEFRAVLNLFTSFGYFEKEADNLATIIAIKKNLEPQGIGIIDFMNVTSVIDNLVEKEEKSVDNILFSIKRYVQEGYIYKDISFDTDTKKHTYTEKVKALTLDDFKNYFAQAGVRLQHTFGDYQLNRYDIKTSPRLIMQFA